MADSGPLAGLRILGFEHSVAAPLATRLLADWGADVLKIERPPKGDFARTWDSSVHGWSSYFVWLNRGKASLCLDLKHSGAASLVPHLVRAADAVVQNLSPSAAGRLGLDSAAVRRINPRAVYVALSGYGSTGPYANRKAYDLLVQGETGLLSLTGTEAAAAKVPIPVADISAGMFAAHAVLLGLLTRERTGAAPHVEVAMFDTLLEWMAGPLTGFFATGRQPPRTGVRHALIVPYGPFQASDGRSVSFAVEQESEWRRFCVEVLEQPDLADDPSFGSNALRLANRVTLEGMIEARWRERGAAEWELRLDAAGIAFGRVNDLQAVAAHPQARERGDFVVTEVAGSAARTVRNPLLVEGRSAPSASPPAMGADGRTALARWGVGEEEIEHLVAVGAVRSTGGDGTVPTAQSDLEIPDGHD